MPLSLKATTQGGEIIPILAGNLKTNNTPKRIEFTIHPHTNPRYLKIP